MTHRRPALVPFPRGVEVRYRTMLLRRVRALDRLVRLHVVPALDPFDFSKAGAPIVSGDDADLHVRVDDLKSRVNPDGSFGCFYGTGARVDAIAGPLALMRALRIAFPRANPVPTDFLTALAGTIDGRLTPVLGVAVVGVPNALDIDGWVAENVRLITSIQDVFLDEVASIIEIAQRGGVSTRNTAKEISARTGVARSRARLIARDQIATVNAQITRQRQIEAGVTEFIWRTSEDERVRESHEALNGQKFRWDAPPAEGIPGEPIQCRCTAEPVLDDVRPA